MAAFSKITFILCLLVSSFSYAASTPEKKPPNPMERPQRPSFSSIDTNDNGDIDFDEFSSHPLPFGDHQTVFESIDINNNGVIEQDEFANHKPPHANNRRKKKND